MARIVVKFGGTSVADPDRIGLAADKVVAEHESGMKVAVIVSAMAGVTNQLMGYCDAIDPSMDFSEKDAVVASGEQVTAGLMAGALMKRGVQAKSFQGWQVPIVCDNKFGKARIINIPSENLLDCWSKNIIPVIAGFQGVTGDHRVATLGRGGSDTTAVAIAAALKADRCDIYTDVTGVFTTDPRIETSAKKIDKITYEEMLEMASVGAKVLHPRAVELAMTYDIPLQVLSSFANETGSALQGTLITKGNETMEKPHVTGVAFSRDEAKITLLHVADTPGIAAAVLKPLADAHIPLDMIVQNIAADGKYTDMTFTIPRGELDRAVTAIKNHEALKNADIRSDKNVAKLSIVGIGMRSQPAFAHTMFKTLASLGVNIQVISSSEIKISVLIDEKDLDQSVRALHKAFALS
jgi:aspartate kinase